MSRGGIGTNKDVFGHRLVTLAAVAAAAVVCGFALVSPASASDGTWGRAWGKNVNGGGVFGVCTNAAMCQAGTNGGLGGEMFSPLGVATDASGNVYVADYINHRIDKFNSFGTWERSWGKNVNGGGVFGVCTVASSCLAGTGGSLGGEMINPVGVATDASGNVYVADQSNRRIQKFDSLGNWQRAWGKDVNGGGGFEVCTNAAMCQAGMAGSLGGEMSTINALGTDASGNVYVSDAGLNHRIQKFDSMGTWQRAWGKDVNSGGVFGVCTNAAMCQAGTTGGLGGEMATPNGVATMGGNVYVADSGVNVRIQKFDSSGTWERAWGKNVNGGGGFEVCTNAAMCQAGASGGLGGELANAFGVATDGSGNVYVADTINHRIQKFDSMGAWQRAWGKNVNGGDAFGVCTMASSCLAGSTGGLGGEMNQPQGVAVAGSNVYVADTANRRIQKFEIPATPPPPGGGGGSITPSTPTALTGQRAAALKKCKKKKTAAARKRCRKRAKQLPV